MSAGRFWWWVVLAIPALAMLVALAGQADLAALTAQSGLWSARLLILALCLTPLQQLLGHRRWLAALIRRRRAIGVAAFLYALLHLAFYVADLASLAAVLDELAAPAILAGWAALALMLGPALTSRDSAMRALGPAWKQVQRLVYPVALLTLGHWLLVHDGRTEALLHFLPLALLQTLRLLRPSRFSPKPERIIA